MSAVASAYTTHYLDEVKKIAEMLDPVKIDRMIQLLRGVRPGEGRHQAERHHLVGLLPKRQGSRFERTPRSLELVFAGWMETRPLTWLL
jgi:hypothetical protein